MRSVFATFRKKKQNEFLQCKGFQNLIKKWEALPKEDEVSITNNGKPAAILFGIGGDGFEETVQAMRQAKAMIAFNKMRLVASENGFMAEKEISLAREERKKK